MREWLRRYRVLMSFSFAASPWQSIFFLLAGAVMSLIPVLAAFCTKLVVDAALSGDLHRGLLAAGVLAALFAGGLVNGLFYIDLLFTVAEKAGEAADRRLIALTAGVPGIEHHERPEYIDRLDFLRQQRGRLGWMTNATAGLVRVAVSLVGSSILLARIDPLLLVLPVLGVISLVAGKRARDGEIAAQEATVQIERGRRHLFDVTASAAAGKEVRLFRLGDELIGRHRAAAQAVMEPLDRADWSGAWIQAAAGLLAGVGYMGAIGLVLVRALHGQATPGDVVLTAGLAAGVNMLVMTAVLYGISFLTLLKLAGHYLWLETYARDAQMDRPAGGQIVERLHSGITFEDVAFQYPGTERQILDGVSLQLPAGAVVALVGENGAGKTTLVKLLSRYYEPTSGRITVDGVPLDEIDPSAWRAHISAGFQDFARFQLLVRETVGVGDLPRMDDRERVGAALVRAGAEDLPGRLPAGLDTRLGREWEDGVELSGGQWQKLALGRAMMRQAPLLLILDEPTASLDAEAEHDLFVRYAEAAREAAETAGTITLLVTHRFSTVRMADLIVVLEGGKITEVGNHTALMERNGLYAELYNLQARAYRNDVRPIP